MLARSMIAAFALVVSAPALAEVADKTATFASMWMWAVGLIAAAVALEMLRPRLGLVVVLFGAFMAWGTHMELSDLHVGPAILRELGKGYVQSSYASAATGLLGPLAVSVLAHLKRRRHRP